MLLNFVSSGVTRHNDLHQTARRVIAKPAGSDVHCA